MKAKTIMIFMLVTSTCFPALAADVQKLFSERHHGIKSVVMKAKDNGSDVCLIAFKDKNGIILGFETSNYVSKITIFGVKSKSDIADIKLNGYRYKGVTLQLRKFGTDYIGEMESILYWDQKPIMHVEGRYIELPNINSYGFSSSISAYDDCVSRMYAE
jgi:hypothetical protein